MRIRDLGIVGAGPAGLQLAYELERRGRDCIVFEAAEAPGAFFERYPRHRTLLSINKVHSGYAERDPRLRYDWNSLVCEDEEFRFAQYSREYFPSADDYVRYLHDFAARFELPIEFETRIVRVERADPSEPFVLTDTRGRSFACRRLVMANGVAEPFMPSIEGIEHAESYAEFSIDPEDYLGQRVLILGKGNSAFETANHLAATARVTHLCSPEPVKLAWQSHYVGDLRAVNAAFLDTYLLKGQNAVLDAEVERIEAVDGEYHVTLRFCHADGQRAQLAYDRILACTGFRWDGSSFDPACRPETVRKERLPAMTSAWESTNVPHLYFAGANMQSRDYHKTMSNVVHGFRFNVCALARVLESRYADQEWPFEKLPLDADVITDHVVRRVSSDPAMMNQPGFLGDLVTISPGSAEARYYESVPVDYVRDGAFGAGPYFFVTLEYGRCHEDPLEMNRVPDPGGAYADPYLHPRIQHFVDGEPRAEHHVSDSLENDWRTDAFPGDRPLVRGLDFIGQTDPGSYQKTHRDALAAFIRGELAASSG